MRKFLIIGLLVLGLVIISCNNGTTDNENNNGGNTKVLIWGSMGFVDGPYTSTSNINRSQMVFGADTYYDLKENIDNKITITARRTKEEFVVCEDYIMSENKYTVQFICRVHIDCFTEG